MIKIILTNSLLSCELYFVYCVVLFSLFDLTLLFTGFESSTLVFKFSIIEKSFELLDFDSFN